MKLVWQHMVEAAQKNIGRGVGWNPSIDPMRQTAMEIVANGHAEEFLKAARRGRPGRDRTLRLQIVQHVEDIQLNKTKRRKPRIRPKRHLEEELKLS